MVKFSSLVVISSLIFAVDGSVLQRLFERCNPFSPLPEEAAESETYFADFACVTGEIATQFSKSSNPMNALNNGFERIKNMLAIYNDDPHTAHKEFIGKQYLLFHVNVHPECQRKCDRTCDTLSAKLCKDLQSIKTHVPFLPISPNEWTLENINNQIERNEASQYILQPKPLSSMNPNTLREYLPIDTFPFTNIPKKKPTKDEGEWDLAKRFAAIAMNPRIPFGFQILRFLEWLQNPDQYQCGELCKSRTMVVIEWFAGRIRKGFFRWIRKQKPNIPKPHEFRFDEIEQTASLKYYWWNTGVYEKDPKREYFIKVLKKVANEYTLLKILDIMTNPNPSAAKDHYTKKGWLFITLKPQPQQYAKAFSKIKSQAIQKFKHHVEEKSNSMSEQKWLYDKTFTEAVPDLSVRELCLDFVAFNGMKYSPVDGNKLMRLLSQIRKLDECKENCRNVCDILQPHVESVTRSVSPDDATEYAPSSDGSVRSTSSVPSKAKGATKDDKRVIKKWKKDKKDKKGKKSGKKKRRLGEMNYDGEEPERVRRGVFGGVSLDEFLRIAEESRTMALEARRAGGENVDGPKIPLHRRLFHGMPYKEWFRHLEEVRQEMSKKYKYRS